MIQKISCFLAFVLLASSSFSQHQSTKMNGVSLVGTKNLSEQSHFDPIKNINANWVTVMPFGFVADGMANVRYNEQWQWVGETVKGITSSIELAKKNNLKVLLKPHIWLHNGWIGDLTFTTEKDFNTFEKSYKAYILTFAKLAEQLKVEVFSIGVELKQIVVARPDFWLDLISDVRKVYTGKLTYAANWDNYENVGFWRELDYIGIDAYFPVATAKTPSFQSCYIGWKDDFFAIKKVSESVNKSVIFTEFGYRNIDYTGKEPWNEASNDSFNSQAQINAYRAIFARFWGETWFAGGFLWKWFPNHSETGGADNNRFTPQNKPVEKYIKDFYGKA